MSCSWVIELNAVSIAGNVWLMTVGSASGEFTVLRLRCPVCISLIHLARNLR